MKLILFFILAGIFMTTPAVAQESKPAQPKETTQKTPPRFEDFPVTEKFTGKSAPVVLRTRDDRMYRTMLREGAQEKVNFAGHYIVTTWGCGSGCVMGGVIDAKTGLVTFIPFTVCCWPIDVPENFEPIEYRLDSRLMIVHGARDEKGNGNYYYKFENNRLVLVYAVEIPLKDK